MNLATDIREAYHDLDLAPGASLEEVRAAYRRLARALHPDLNPGSRGALMGRVNRAYQKLLAHLSGQEASIPPPRPVRPRPATRPYIYEEFQAPPRRDKRERKSRHYRRALKVARAVARAAEAAEAAGPTPPAPTPGEFYRASRASTPAGEQTPSWRLLGLEERNGCLVYKVEVSGRPQALTLPVRRIQSCPHCGGSGVLGRGRHRRTCPDCGGRGSITRSDRMQVELPPQWGPGWVIPAPQAGRPLAVELIPSPTGQGA